MPLFGEAVMIAKTRQALDMLLVAVPETAGSALYGTLDVLLAVGNIWQALERRIMHADSVVRGCEYWLVDRYSQTDALRQVAARAGAPERALKRRFKVATGVTLIEYIQNLRDEEAKRLLENDTTAVEEISAAVGYEDTSFFRQLFKRLAGLTPSKYRRMIKPIISAAT